MEKNTFGTMPPEYEYLSPALMRAQEHVFLINKEIEELGMNPIYEDTLIKLQEERQTVIKNIKQDFEMQTWEDGPFKFEEVEQVIDQHMSNEAYRNAITALKESNKTYDKSAYWADMLKRNLEHFKIAELTSPRSSHLEKDETAMDFSFRDWHYDFDMSEPSEIDIEPERD